MSNSRSECLRKMMSIIVFAIRHCHERNSWHSFSSFSQTPYGQPAIKVECHGCRVISKSSSPKDRSGMSRVLLISLTEVSGKEERETRKVSARVATVQKFKALQADDQTVDSRSSDNRIISTPGTTNLKQKLWLQLFQQGNPKKNSHNTTSLNNRAKRKSSVKEDC